MNLITCDWWCTYAGVHVENIARNLLHNATLLSRLFVLIYVSDRNRNVLCVRVFIAPYWEWTNLKFFANLTYVKYLLILVIWISLITKKYLASFYIYIYKRLFWSPLLLSACSVLCSVLEIYIFLWGIVEVHIFQVYDIVIQYFYRLYFI